MAILTPNETKLLNVLLRNARFKASGFTVEGAHADIKEDILWITFQVADDLQTDPLLGEAPLHIQLPVRGLDTERIWDPLLEVEPGSVQTERRRYVSFGPIPCGNSPVIEIGFTSGKVEEGG